MAGTNFSVSGEVAGGEGCPRVVGGWGGLKGVRKLRKSRF